MEVTSVSSSVSSTTEGDDVCEIDVSNVAIHSVTLLISLCGLVGNGAVLWLLSLKVGNSRIFHLAFTDFLFLLFTVPSSLLFLVEDLSCTPILSLLYLRFLFQLSVVSYYWALFRLFRTRDVDYMEMLCELCCRWKPPERLLWLVDSVEFWAFFALFTIIPTVTLQCPSHHQEQCRAALISLYAVMLLLSFVPSVLSHTVILIKAKWGSKEQQPKRRNIVISLVVLLVFLLSLCNFLQQLGYIIVSSQVVFLLNCIQSSIKPFIYFLAGRCWRPCSVGSLQLSLQRIFDEPEENTAHSNGEPRPRAEPEQLLERGCPSSCHNPCAPSRRSVTLTDRELMGDQSISRSLLDGQEPGEGGSSSLACARNCGGFWSQSVVKVVPTFSEHEELTRV